MQALLKMKIYGIQYYNYTQHYVDKYVPAADASLKFISQTMHHSLKKNSLVN